MPRLHAALVRGEGGKGRGDGGSPAAVDCGSWQAVVGETLAGAMPEVARGRMRGVPGCCAVVDPSSSSVSSVSSADVLSRDASYSPLPLMVRALQDVVGDLHAARMVRDAFSWIVRGAGELAEATNATVVEQDRRIDELGSLVWSLGDLRRSLPLHDTERVKVSAAAGDDDDEGDSGGGGGGGGERGSVSFMRVVVEQMQVHLVRVLDATASVPLPECPFASFKMESGYECEHVGWWAAEEGFEGEPREARGCVMCKEVVKPFMDNPYECWTSWVPWAGTDADEFSPAFYRRLGLSCSVEGGDVKVRPSPMM